MLEPHDHPQIDRSMKVGYTFLLVMLLLSVASLVASTYSRGRANRPQQHGHVAGDMSMASR